MQIKDPVEQCLQQAQASAVDVRYEVIRESLEEQPCEETNVGSISWSKLPFWIISECQARDNCTKSLFRL